MKTIRLDTLTNSGLPYIYIRAVINKSNLARDLYFAVQTDSIEDAYSRVKKLLPHAKLFVLKFDEIKELEKQKKFDSLQHCEDFGENGSPLFEP